MADGINHDPVATNNSSNVGQDTLRDTNLPAEGAAKTEEESHPSTAPIALETPSSASDLPPHHPPPPLSSSSSPSADSSVPVIYNDIMLPDLPAPSILSSVSSTQFNPDSPQPTSDSAQNTPLQGHTQSIGAVSSSNDQPPPVESSPSSDSLLQKEELPLKNLDHLEAQPTLELPVLEAVQPSENSVATDPAVGIRPPIRESHSAPGGISFNNNMSLADPPLGASVHRPVMPPAQQSSFISTSATNPDIVAKMQAFHQSRQGGTPGVGGRSLGSPNPSLGLPMGRLPGGFPASGLRSPMPLPVNGTAGALRLPGGFPTPRNIPSGAMTSPGPAAAPKKLSLREKRNMNLPGGLPPSLPTAGGPGAGAASDSADGSIFNKFSDYVDTKTGTLKFAGKATVHGSGIDFSSGSSFSISLDEVDNLAELGKGNYGTVYKVRHSRPKMRRPGMGLRGNRMSTQLQPSQDPSLGTELHPQPHDPASNGLSGVVMAMKEIRLELDEAKLAAIIMELDILHRCTSPFIIDFYGAFFQEGAVYICMEFMDGGSVDKLYGDGVPEGVLRKITLSTVMGLKSLKDDHNIIHRDVKPTNILVNSRGQIKLCDFGVSGNLVASIAKTNIGCQSYMAPERISGGGVAQAGSAGGTYSVQSDIWSLGLSILECAKGRYPYPPETYNNIFGQLSAIVDGEPPQLPTEGYSEPSHKFVAACLNKNPKLRPTYASLLRYAWLAPLMQIPTISEDDEEANDTITKDPNDTSDEEVALWVKSALEKRAGGSQKPVDKPALHTAALDSVSAANVPKPVVEESAAA